MCLLICVLVCGILVNYELCGCVGNSNLHIRLQSHLQLSLVLAKGYWCSIRPDIELFKEDGVGGQ